MALQQIRILSPTVDGRTYAGLWVLGRVLRASRGQTVTDGAELPVGASAFQVPAGTVSVGHVLRVRHQHFRVTGVEPVPPFFVEDVVTAEQSNGRFPEALGA